MHHIHIIGGGIIGLTSAWLWEQPAAAPTAEEGGPLWGPQERKSPEEVTSNL